jgi:hypothetical protein
MIYHLSIPIRSAPGCVTAVRVTVDAPSPEDAHELADIFLGLHGAARASSEPSRHDYVQEVTADARGSLERWVDEQEDREYPPGERARRVAARAPLAALVLA